MDGSCPLSRGASRHASDAFSGRRDIDHYLPGDIAGTAQMRGSVRPPLVPLRSAGTAIQRKTRFLE